ncbi:MAG: AraC family transcriptional regulator [Paraglaciecola sp.]|uniref:AraC family transcriptional regulator n=1 Tax=Paraglaciecola sp. TaxID=1920173 RepID=UPI00329962D5
MNCTKIEKADFKIANAYDGIEMVNADYKNRNFSKHVHEGYTIAVVDKGAQRFYRSGAEHFAGQGSIILVNADDVHNGQSATSDGWRYRGMYPTPEQFNLITGDLTQGKHAAPYFNQSVIEDVAIATQLRIMFQHVENNSTKLLIETLMYSVMVNLVARHSSLPYFSNCKSSSKQKLQLAKEYLDAYPEQNVSLTQLATLVGLSQFHFVREFKKQFELTPHSYQVQVRVKKAKRLLKVGVKPINVASDCGFHDQSHLNHYFKKALGTTPRKYQKQVLVEVS